MRLYLVNWKHYLFQVFGIILMAKDRFNKRGENLMWWRFWLRFQIIVAISHINLWITYKENHRKWIYWFWNRCCCCFVYANVYILARHFLIVFRVDLHHGSIWKRCIVSNIDTFWMCVARVFIEYTSESGNVEWDMAGVRYGKRMELWVWLILWESKIKKWKCQTTKTECACRKALSWSSV